MSSLNLAAGRSVARNETIGIVLLLAFAGGYIDAYTWIIHGVMANAQTSNLIFLWVATKNVPNLALAIPVVVLLVVLLRCEVPHQEAT